MKRRKYFASVADMPKVNSLSVQQGLQELSRLAETCRRGTDPKKSVLNAYNQSHDIKNLFVVDGSSFVTAGTQNPTMTICALAMRASEYLADQLSKKEL